MLLSLVVAVVLAPAPTPSPGPFPLKEIASVRSTPFCTALRDNIAPAIVHILDNDQQIAASRPVFPKLYHDAVIFRSGFAEFDYQRLNDLITPMSKNLVAMRSLLGDKYKFPAKAKTADDADLLALRDRFQAIEQAQNNVLNVINGMLMTKDLAEIQEAPVGLGMVGDPLSRQNAVDPEAVPGLQTRAGLPRSPGDPIDPAVDIPPGPFANPFAPFDETIADQQVVIDKRENEAAQAIFAVLPRCRPTTP